MIIPLDTLLMLLIVPAALWYLGSRATITRSLWSRYPGWLTALTDCAACSGFWWGLIGYTIAWYAKAIPREGPYTQYTAPVFGFVTLITTPLIAYLHDQGLYRLGTVSPVDELPAAGVTVEELQAALPLAFREFHEPGMTWEAEARRLVDALQSLKVIKVLPVDDASSQ